MAGADAIIPASRTIPAKKHGGLCLEKMMANLSSQSTLPLEQAPGEGAAAEAMTTRSIGGRDGRQNRRTLPPLDYLLAFEAAALDTSFAKASKRLNISETAISRKVRLLEQHLGVTFFRRGQRSINLTAPGRDFLARIRPALDAIRDAAQEAMDIGRNRPVVLAATNSVAALWLTPRLHTFRHENPHLKIMLVSSDSDSECLDDSVDLTILRGDGTWAGYESHLVFGETVFPVCSPAFLRDHPEVAEVGNLPQAPLIEVASAHTEWMNWRAWLEHFGSSRLTSGQATLFNTYPLSIQAAVDGVGVALGWGHLVDQLLEAGRLVRPLGAAQVRTSHGYFLLISEGRVLSPGVRQVADWLRQVSAVRRRYALPQAGEAASLTETG